MRWCTQCGFTLDSPEQTCPRCQQGSDPSSPPAWTAVARFTSAAEAGYFANELASQLQGEPRIHELEQTNPLTHCLHSVYVLKVESPEADRAALLIKELLAATDDPSSASSPWTSGSSKSGWTRRGTSWEADTEEREVATSGINWVPIVLTLTAGTLVLWAARKPMADGPAAPGLDDLWHSLSLDPEPWIQRGPNGASYRQLTIDPQRERIVIRRDANGDGQFDVEELIFEYRPPRK